MNNLDSRCPNIVNVEVHFNNFMGDIFDGWKNRQENADVIEDYEFNDENEYWGAWDNKAFHLLINEHYVDYLNSVIRNPSAFEDLTNELWENFNDDFSNWVDKKWITIWLEGEK